MRKPLLADTVYATLFPRQRSSDPGSFSAHISRNLVPEVRIEIRTFYGPIDCIEAQFPGLDYSHQPHRLRLSRFPWHRRLFRAFDELKLTADEIEELCCWEGTKSVRERYELEEGIIVRDTTGESTRRDWSPPPSPTVTRHPDFYIWMEEKDAEDYYDTLETHSDDTVRASDSRSSSVLADFPPALDEDSDEEVESCGLALNNRLLVATAARAQGANVPVDEDYEQWVRDASGPGGYDWIFPAIFGNQPLNNPEAATTVSPSSSGTDNFGQVQARQVEESIVSASLAAARHAVEARYPPYTEPPAAEHYSSRLPNWHELLAEDEMDSTIATQPHPSRRTPNVAR